MQKQNAMQQINESVETKGTTSYFGREVNYYPMAGPTGPKTSSYITRQPMATTIYTATIKGTNHHNSIPSQPSHGDAPFKRHYAAEIRQKKEKGLCYYCDDQCRAFAWM